MTDLMIDKMNAEKAVTDEKVMEKKINQMLTDLIIGMPEDPKVVLKIYKQVRSILQYRINFLEKDITLERK